MKRLLLTAALSMQVCFCATTTTWEITGYQDFLRGRLSGLALTHDGMLGLGPRLDPLFDSGQPEIWSIAKAPDGSIYAATGHRGRLYRIDASGKSSLAWTADQPEIFAIALDAKGAVYAATSPDGKVYRIENGKATEYFAPGARYIWSLAVAPNGDLYVGTGDQGKIFRVTSQGHGSVFYDTGQAHVTCLALDSQGRLLAGSEPNGILYRIDPQGRAFVLYDAALPEIRAIVPAADGSIYAAALGGSVAKRLSTVPASPVTPQITGAPISVTVTDAQAGSDIKPKVDSAKPVAATPTSAIQTTVTDYSGVDRSALYKIYPDNTVETLWSSKDEDIYDLVVHDGVIHFATDVEGRIYQLGSDRKATLVAQTNEGETTRLLYTAQGLLAATGSLGKIYRLNSSGAQSKGWFESPVHDSQSVARWGRISWRGASSKDASSKDASAKDASPGLSFRTRTGNSLRPDSTWSDWSAPISDPSTSTITSPNARYIQWRAEFSAVAGAAPTLDGVTVAYLPQNTPPIVRSITATMQSAAKAASGSTSTAAAASYSITVTDSGSDTSTAAGTPTQALSRAGGSQMQISWQADDPDGDHLSYNLYFRGEDETEWKLLRANMSDNAYLLDGDLFADGRYLFRVVASDGPSNPPALARETEMISAPVLVDGTPPTVTLSAPRRSGSTAEIDVKAEDHATSLRRCEFSIDAGPWTPVEAVDGVTDSPREEFLVRAQGLTAGEHLIVVRVYDSVGNAGLAKAVVH